MDTAQRKLCLMGDPGVGKSTIAACLDQIRDERPGVSLHRWIHAGSEFAVWDSGGRSLLDTLGQTFLAGADGYIVVADPARGESLDTARQLIRHAFELAGRRPTLLLLNRFDGPPPAALPTDLPDDVEVRVASAARCDEVLAAITSLAERILAR